MRSDLNAIGNAMQFVVEHALVIFHSDLDERVGEAVATTVLEAERADAGGDGGVQELAEQMERSFGL